MDKLRIDSLIVAGEIDAQGHLLVTIEAMRPDEWLDKSDAEDLVDHLIAVFDLKYKKEEPSEE